ncbi:hypothetical protein Unana1_01910 [Umbelopsis nana]
MTAVKKANDNSMSYLHDYSDTTVELPLELNRSYALIRQLDESAEVADECWSLTSCNKKLSREERTERLRNISSLLNETIKRGEEKFALAKSTYDTIDRHCSRLDNDLQKFEDEQLIGPGRTMSVQPSSLDETNAEEENEERKAHVDSAIIRSSLTPRNDTKISSNLHTARPKGRKRGRKPKAQTQEIEEQPVTPTFGFGISADNVQAAVAISDMPVDPNEPVYCVCRQVSYGEMVACDNDEVSIAPANEGNVRK